MTEALLCSPHSQFEHPNVHIRRVKEFRFREIASHSNRGGGSSRSSTDPDDIDVNSVDNLVTEPDDDEVTNSRAGARLQSHSGERRQSGTVTSRTSQWIIDGDELPRAEIEVRCVEREGRGEEGGVWWGGVRGAERGRF